MILCLLLNISIKWFYSNWCFWFDESFNIYQMRWHVILHMERQTLWWGDAACYHGCLMSLRPWAMTSKNRLTFTMKWVNLIILKILFALEMFVYVESYWLLACFKMPGCFLWTTFWFSKIIKCHFLSTSLHFSRQFCRRTKRSFL